VSDTIYRPLFAVVEALEGAIKAKLPIPGPVKTSSLSRALLVIERELQNRYANQIAIVREAGQDAVLLGMRCPFCKKWDRLYITELELELEDSAHILDTILDGFDKLEATPCSELALPISVQDTDR
jgi:hypothetical protein